MANFKVCVRGVRKDGLMPVYIRITHNRTVAYLKTDKLVNSKGLNRHGDVCDRFVLKYCSERIDDFLIVLNRYSTQCMTASDIKMILAKGNSDTSFTAFATRYLNRIGSWSKVSTIRLYEAALRSLQRYVNRDEIGFEELTVGMLLGWIDSLGCTKRAKTLYPICIRQIFTEAYSLQDDVSEHLPKLGINPWSRIEIPHSSHAEKIAVPAEDLRRFFAWAPDTEGRMERYRLGRDVAMMSFCLAGMNSVDIFKLKKKDFSGGVLHYCRSKTEGRRADEAYFEIKVPRILQSVFERNLADDGSEYLFFFADRYKDSKSFNVIVNAGIKLICDRLGLEHGYTLYTFRHSWATIAQNEFGKSLSDVGFAMNHSRNRVTRGYIKLDFSPAWELNERVVDFVFFSEQESKLYAREQSLRDESAAVFVLSPRMLIRAAAFFQGRCLASFENIGYGDIEEVTKALVALLPANIPDGSMVLFKIVNCDDGKVYVCEHQKGKDLF